MRDAEKLSDKEFTPSIYIKILATDYETHCRHLSEQRKNNAAAFIVVIYRIQYTTKYTLILNIIALKLRSESENKKDTQLIICNLSFTIVIEKCGRVYCCNLSCTIYNQIYTNFEYNSVKIKKRVRKLKRYAVNHL